MALQELILPNQKGYGTLETGTIVIGPFSFCIGLTILCSHSKLIFMMMGGTVIEDWIMSTGSGAKFGEARHVSSPNTNNYK